MALEYALMVKKDFQAWINNRFLDWQREQGERKTISEFAELTGIKQPLMSHYLNGTRVPSRENADKIATVLGNEIYNLLDMCPTDLREMINKIPPENQEELRDLIEAYILRQGWERIA